MEQPEKLSYALALQGTSPSLITSVSGTGNQYIHSQADMRAVGESDKRNLEEAFNLFLQNVDEPITLTTYKLLSGVIMFAKLLEVLVRQV